MITTPPSITLRGKIFFRHLVQASVACLTLMVQGNFAEATLGHWQVALTTGSGAGLLAVIFSIKPLDKWIDNKWYTALSAFVATFCADIWVHPTHFGSPFSEALYTAAGAALISLLVSFVNNKK